jgi:pyruvate,water dikinase
LTEGRDAVSSVTDKNCFDAEDHYVQRASKMTSPEKPMDEILHSLQERAKELNCLYQIDEILSHLSRPMDETILKLMEALPGGWRYPGISRAMVILDGRSYQPPGFAASEWFQRADVIVDGEKIGHVSLYYTELRPTVDEGPFLKEEQRLINAVAGRIGFYLLQKRVRHAHDSLEAVINKNESQTQSEWSVIMDFLRRTDPDLMTRITRKMINYLCWTGAHEADELLQEFLAEGGDSSSSPDDENRPTRRELLQDISSVADRTLAIASANCSEEEMIGNIRAWIEEEKASYLVETLESPCKSIDAVDAALERFESSEIDEHDLPEALRKSLRVSLLRRFFSDNIEFLNIIKKHVHVADFRDLLKKVIYMPKGQGKLGGKSAGLFLAEKLLKGATQYADVFVNIKVPKTWYISSDVLFDFMRLNHLEDIYGRKYMDIETVRRDYRRVVQVFKHSRFPHDIVKSLSLALDDFEDRPLVVRSSSLLEDQVGAAFSGKYKSLFVANQGSKKERLDALMDAIAEVYASIFGPDPIEYRAERGLLDVHEEMAIMIQEVVGERVGKYFLPAFAGVAFGQNEFRWSPRIKREDGLIRLVPGLGTRAVDRLSDDYPVLISPGQPGLRVNATPDETARYSPRKIDIINLDNNVFETVAVDDLLREVGDDYPLIRKIISIVGDNEIRPPTGLQPDWQKDDVVVTFQGLIDDGIFVERIRLMLEYLQGCTGYPVDTEFAVDSKHIYLLQCRAQSATPKFAPAPIPRDLPEDKVLFSANRYISNGRVPDVTHIVYVDPDSYANIGSLSDLKDVGRAVGKLNKLLPKRQFILIGPGRWGSRGDIRLGVGVTYSDINNTSVLLEVARQRGQYVPELSFGTHFFQDLVEADIRYIPLYPDEEGIEFNEEFLKRAKSIFKDLVPEYAQLEDTIRVIDVPAVADGNIVKILMNADLDEAIGILSPPSTDKISAPFDDFRVEERPEDHWRWRLRMAERIAAGVDHQRFGVKAMYVFGSAKNATAGPASDVDILIHVADEPEKREALSLWLAGWSRALAEVNHLRTGYKSDGLLDIHFVTDQDIANRTSFAAKIGAVTDAARPLILGPPAA